MSCTVCDHPRRGDFDAVLRTLSTGAAAKRAVRELCADESGETRPGHIAVAAHFKHGHQFGKVDEPVLTNEMVAAKARRILNDKLDSLPAKDLKDLVFQDMKLAEAREKTKQLLAGKRKDDDPNKDAMEAAARALGHHKARLAVVGNLVAPNERASG